MKIKVIATSLYALFGAVFLLIGAGVLLLTTRLLPGALENLITQFGHDDPTTLHIIQELGSVFIFVGLITFWFIRHYEQSLVYHWSMTVFLMLLALVHWFDVRGTFHPGSGQLVDTIPFILFVLVGLLRKKFERRSD